MNKINFRKGYFVSSVSVQIVTYNSEKDIKSCLDSVFSQSYPLQKVTIIDNQSQDRTLKIIESFNNIQLFKNDFNNGFAGGHNQGIQNSVEDYVLVLNPDVRLHEDYIKNIISTMKHNTDIGIATGKLYREIDKKILDSTGLIMKKNRRAFDRSSGEIDEGQYNNPEVIFGVSGAAAMYRREMIQEISYQGQFFDESFFAYKEDVDVSWRAQLFGWKAQYVPNAVAEHGRGWQEEKKRVEIPLFIRQKSYINRYYCILKNDQLSYFALHLPFIIAYEIASFTYAILKERKLLLVWKSFIREYKTMLEKRKMIQRNRKSTNKQIYSYFKGVW